MCWNKIIIIFITVLLQYYDELRKLRSTTGQEQCLRLGQQSVAESDSLHPASKSTSAVSLCCPSALQSIVVRRVHRDFVGLETSDSTTQSAVINFSYHLTVGDMDEAFRAIRVVKWSAVTTALVFFRF